MWPRKKLEETDPISNPFTDETSLGNILLRMNRLTKEQLFRAVGIQARARDHLLGALLIETGAVSDVDVAAALAIQAKMRGGERVNAELDLLDRVVGEAQACNAALGEALTKRSDRIRKGETVLRLVKAHEA